ncbi:ribbon-helix-helix domain-containing protein [Methylorubrum extorquens]|jgi:antitoxin ParD1/3/4|uniref:ribbon-helix-helix domain-containing protein n=1 Tax=Methylorubrum extorquens TaxID=408 RepID=UPI001EE5EB05|nr:ribbon-helix-helix domain-containing protein [Methylorubrum extorquens]MCG5248216.1 ribbon-helix-helix domain-containing protein [Methylorubrum extorquens]
MPAKHSRHIALTETLAAWIDAQVAKGEYASTSDLIRTAIRVLRVQDEGKAAARPAAPMALPHGKGRA